MKHSGSEKVDGKQYLREPNPLPKTPTYIGGLDEVLHGGLPTDRLTIVNGGPGAGKTYMAMELLIRGIEAGNTAVFISFEESKEAMRRNAGVLGWDLAAMENDGKLALINPPIDFEAVVSGEFDIQGLCAILAGQAKAIGAKIIVIDAIDMILRMFDNISRARNQLVILHRWLIEQNLTTIITVKAGYSKHELDYLDFMADCVISLDQRVLDQVNTRRLQVKKYRGSDFASREHPFVISGQGIVVMPLTSVDMVQQKTGEFLKSGNDKLDVVLGGGIRRGSSVLISGPSGSGKTSLAFKLSVSAVQDGDKVLYVSLEQSSSALISEMKSIGLNLEPLIERGDLRITSIMPEAMGMEEHLYRMIQEIEEFKPRHIVLDAISGTSRIGSDRAAQEFLIRLYHVAKTKDITCMYTNQIFPSMRDDLELSGLGISSLVDTAIILNYFREKDRIGRTIMVLKSRGTRHSDRYHEFHITDNGIVIEDSENIF